MSPPPPERDHREQRFRTLYTDTYPDLLRFVSRRVHPSHAEDVAADVFMVAWRRVEDLPQTSDDVRAWLFGTARRMLLNERRGTGRRQALAVRIAEHAQQVDPHSDYDLVEERCATG